MTTASTAALGLGPLVAGDINGDGKQDVIVELVSGDQIDLVSLERRWQLYARREHYRNVRFESVVLVDLNKDGRLDLIAVSTIPTAPVYRGTSNFTITANLTQASQRQRTTTATLVVQ